MAGSKWTPRAFQVGVAVLNVVLLCGLAGMFIFPDPGTFAMEVWSLVLAVLQITVPILSIMGLLWPAAIEAGPSMK